jgi:hypothetical protein
MNLARNATNIHEAVNEKTYTVFFTRLFFLKITLKKVIVHIPVQNEFPVCICELLLCFIMLVCKLGTVILT